MKTPSITNDEKNIKRVVLLSSTVIIFIVSIMIAYLLINSEIENFNNHLKSFKSTLIEREKFSIRTTMKNLVNDIHYEEISRKEEIKQRVKEQALSMTNLTQSFYLQNKNQNTNAIINVAKKLIQSTTTSKDEIHYFIFNTNGLLLLNTNNKNSENKNFIDFEDINGKKFVQKILKKDGFSYYYWFKPNSSKVAYKITYSQKIKDLDIVIGAGAFENTTHKLSPKILNKIKKYNFGKDEFLFIYNINSLNNPVESSELILEKNIQTNSEELFELKNILVKSDYKTNVFHEYKNRLIYSVYLPSIRTFISEGVYLDSINKIVEKETTVSHKNLIKKIIFLIVSILLVTIVFFIFSYIISKKIELMFKNYRIKVAHSQQLLIQKSKMASMGEMIGNIAHQWRQPLSQLSGLFFDIESAYDFKELDKKYLTNTIDEANDLVEYMSKTIDDFKEFFNPNAKKEKFNLLEPINNALNIVSSALKSNHIQLNINVDNSLYVEGLSNEFSQVILNLLSNSQEIALLRDIKKPKINIFTELYKNEIFLHVEDNCGGIDEAILDKIFEPYFTTKFHYGTGIGLYMSKIIVENKMNGHIYVKNIENNKTRFTITIKKSLL